MSKVFHITSGDIAGGNLAKAGLPGEVFVWHDILYAGPRQPGRPGENTLRVRARFPEEFTAGGLDRDGVLRTLHHQYQSLALAAIRSGCETPGKIFTSVAAADTPPQFWGDTTLWAKINGLAHRVPPLVRIEGPTDRLPQWESQVSLKEFKIKALPDGFSGSQPSLTPADVV